MKLTVLKRALEMLATQNQPDLDKKQIFKALQEVHETAERATDNDVYDDEVYLISASAFGDILNNSLYDVYAQRAVKHGPNFPVSYFQHDARKMFGFEDFTNEQLQIGYEIIADLWSDNEADGRHEETTDKTIDD